jgi:hypothetical protein
VVEGETTLKKHSAFLGERGEGRGEERLRGEVLWRCFFDGDCVAEYIDGR